MFKKYRYIIPYSLLTLLLIACGDTNQPESSQQVKAPAINPISTLYNQSCISCHMSGAVGAPRAHDVAAWQPRLEQGMDILLEHSKNGLGAMPPMGMCGQCSDEDLVSLIEFMSKAK